MKQVLSLFVLLTGLTSSNVFANARHCTYQNMGQHEFFASLQFWKEKIEDQRVLLKEGKIRIREKLVPASFEFEKMVRIEAKKVKETGLVFRGPKKDIYSAGKGCRLEVTLDVPTKDRVQSMDIPKGFKLNFDRKDMKVEYVPYGNARLKISHPLFMMELEAIGKCKAKEIVHALHKAHIKAIFISSKKDKVCQDALKELEE